MHPRLAYLTLVLAATVGSGAGCSCGGNNAGNAQDAGLDAPVQFDAPRDTTVVNEDAGPTCGTFQVPNGCGFELTRCTVAKDNSDECLGLDCVSSGLYGLVCLRKCGCSAECGVNTICLPSKTTDYMNAADATQIIGNAKGHCFYSFCGGAGDDTSPFGNGNFFGACDMGKDAFIKDGKVDTRPGTCFPLSTDVPEGYLKLGICQEAGATPRGGTCTYDLNQCAEPATFDMCAVGTTCIGRQGDLTGTCAKLCNPNAGGFNPAVPGDCASDSDVTYDQFCQDSSSYQRDCIEPTVDGGTPIYNADIFYNYVGFCVDSPACDLFAAANTCANVTGDGGVEMHGCEPTTPINPYGLCGTAGTVAVGDPCNNTLLCQPGLVCITWQGQTQGTCEKYCGLGPNDAKWPCGANEFCSTILYGSDPSRSCDDDPFTLGFGVCKPDTRQDAGVQDDAAAQDDAAVQDDAAPQQDGATDV